MRVGVDARHLADVRGVANYSGELVGALSGSFPRDRWRLFAPGHGALGRAEAALARGNVELRRHALPGRALFGAAALLGRPRLDRLLGEDLDVLWMPAPAPVALTREVPLVLTMHDLSFELRPRDFTAYERAWHQLARLPRLARRASAIMADSRHTRELLLARWGVEPARVEVVHPGVRRPSEAPDGDTIARVRRRYGLPDRYLLFVGALEPRKAPDLLARAYARARECGLDAELAMVGAGRLARSLRGPGVWLLGTVGDADRDALYAGAVALVMPSWVEGFGLPPLEAAVLGTPAVLTDLPAFDDTLGEASLRVRAGDEEALASAMLRIAGEPELRARLARDAARAASRFTWEAAARGAHAVLSRAAEGR